MEESSQQPVRAAAPSHLRWQTSALTSDPAVYEPQRAAAPTSLSPALLVARPEDPGAAAPHVLVCVTQAVSTVCCTPVLKPSRGAAVHRPPTPGHQQHMCSDTVTGKGASALTSRQGHHLDPCSALHGVSTQFITQSLRGWPLGFCIYKRC